MGDLLEVGVRNVDLLLCAIFVAQMLVEAS
jgi:hypothetical protein